MDEYNILFDYIYNILENEECSVTDILNRNIKRKYLLPQSFINLFDDKLKVINNKNIEESKIYTYIDKISLAIDSCLQDNKDINVLKLNIRKPNLLPNNFWNIISYVKNNNNTDIFIERPNYIEFIKNIQEQNFKSGITIQATGTGKSFQILKLIDVYEQKNKDKKNDYLIIAPKIDILRDMFYKDNSLDKNKFEKLKRSKIIDINSYNIVNMVTEDFNKKSFSKEKPNIIIANMQYLIFMQDKNVAILEKNLRMCIFDECHNVSGNEIFKFIENLDNIINIGFSATPLRNTTTKLINKFYKIYGDGKKINVISSFDIFDGIAYNIILPFKHYFFEFKSCYKVKRKLINSKENESDSDSEYFDTNTDNDSDNINIDNESFDDINSDDISIDESALDYNKSIVKNVIMKDIIDKLPYKKIICWCRTKKLAKKQKEWFENNFKSYNTYLSISGSENKEEDKYLDFKYLYPINEKTEIKAILFCVGRCKEGSDIDFVDCGLYLDPVKNRSIVVSMQTAGRIMRLDKYNKKTHAIIIEGYISDSYKNKLNSDLIISYYKKILQISEDKNNYIEKLKFLSDNTIYDTATETIRLKIDNNTNHDCILKTDLKNNDWINTKKIIQEYTKKQVIIRTEKYKELENNINIIEIKNNNFYFSKIKNAIINNKKLENLNYVKLIILCYSEINNIDKILENNIVKIEKNKKNDKGFKYFKDLNISIQGQDAKYSITEVIRQCIINKLDFDINIELKNKNILKLTNKN